MTVRGLTTSLFAHPGGASAQIDFDLCRHELVIATHTGGRRTMELRPGPVAEFYEEFHRLLDELGIGTDTWPVPVEIEHDAIPMDEDRLHTAYDPDQAHRYWRVLVQSTRVLEQFRARFTGKVSPVHYFWGSPDLAVTRFSGREAPPHPGGAPNCGPHVMHDAYSHEVSSAGYAPMGDGEGFFYSYAYPTPDRFADAPVRPDGASFDEDLGEFVLPYEAVRTADDPEAYLLEFLQSTYEAAAELADWDRAALDG